MSWENSKKNFSLSSRLSKRLSRLLSKLVWRDDAMTQTRSALTLLADHLAELSRRPEGALALERFGAAGLDLRRAGDLSVLVAQCAPPCGRARRGEVFATLIPAAPSDPIAAQCVVAALRPELTRMARVLARGALDREEAQSEMVAIGLDVVTRRGCGAQRAAEPVRVLDAIWNKTRRTAGMRRRGLLEVVALAEELDLPSFDPDPLERWPGLLAAAVAQRVLTPRQVVIIAQTRMEGRPLTEVARALGRPWGSAFQERRRGEEALRSFGLAYAKQELR